MYKTHYRGRALSSYTAQMLTIIFNRIRYFFQNHVTFVQMKRTHKPIENSYWVIPGRFLAGEYPGDIDDESSRVKINALILSGITAFIDLTEENEGLLPYTSLLKTATHQRFPIRDVSIPSSTDITIAILDAIGHQIRQGGVVYLHCWGGVGRTGVIVGCWLARHGFKGKAALARLQELWEQCPKSEDRQSPDTNKQEQYIVNWKEAR